MSHNAVSTLHPSTGAPPTPTPQPHQSSQRVSKAILKTAIQKANSAVVLDKANDLDGAIDAYTEAVNLLNRVLSSETRESDRQRLQETYDKYIKRIQYLGTLKSDAADLYETFENGAKMLGNDTTRSTKSLGASKQQQHQQQQQQQQDKGRSDVWVRKMASSSSLDSKSNRWDMDGNTSPTNTTNTARFATRSSGGSLTTANATRLQQQQQQQQQRQQTGSNASSTTAGTPTSPSSSVMMPLDVPPSPVSSKSTPSRPTSNRKSNEPLNTTSMDPPPPLEPRSIHRPSPRKSSRTGAAAALQQVSYPVATSSAEQDNQPHTQQRRSSMSSLSSTSSSDSDIIRVSGSNQPAMALPSLLHTKMESTSTVSKPTSIAAGSDSDIQPNNRNSNGSNDTNNSNSINSTNDSGNDSSRYGSLKLTTTSSTSTASLLSSQEETPPSGGGGFGRLRTSSLPRKLHFTRPAIGSSTRMQRLASNASSLDVADSPPSSSSGVPMRRNVTQPSTPVTAATEADSASIRTISGPAQRQSSGLSMRKKYNRLSRTSMDSPSGNIINGNNNNSSSNSNNNGGNGGGRKEKSGPIFSTLFGGSGSPYSSSSGRSTEEAMNYFGRHHHGDSQQPYSPSLDSTKHSSMDSETLSSSTATSSMALSQQQEDGAMTMNRYLDVHLKLIIALEHSMNYGGYITPKLFIPKNLWHQTNIRLSSMDIKVAACESLILDLNRIEKWRNLDDIRGSLRLIESLEEVVDGLQVTLSKKLKRDSLVDTNDDTSSIYSPDGSVLQTNGSQPYSSGGGGNGGSGSGGSHHHGNGNNGSNNIGGVSNNGGGSINKRTQFMSWGSKLSKSVERMNNFSLTKVEDQHRHYIEALQKLFIKLHMLEMWFQHYLKKDRQKNPHYDVLLTKLGKVCDGINRVVGGFVLRDVAILLGKWLKRGGVWVNE